MERKDLLTRLADAGEEAISKLGGAPGADRFLGVANSMRERIDELQKKVRGLDELERRVAHLEKQVAAELKPARGKGTTRPSSRRSSTRSSRQAS